MRPVNLEIQRVFRNQGSANAKGHNGECYQDIALQHTRLQKARLPCGHGFQAIQDMIPTGVEFDRVGRKNPRQKITKRLMQHIQNRTRAKGYKR